MSAVGARQASTLARRVLSPVHRRALGWLKAFLESFPLAIGHFDGMLGCREAAALDIGFVFAEGARHLVMQIGVLHDKTRGEALKQAQHIVSYQHLAVTAHPSANANGGDFQALGYQLCQPGRDRFEHQAETACFLQQ